MFSYVPFKELAGKKVALVGYGIEGKSTEKFLREFSPDTSITVLDQSFDSHYLEILNKSGNFDCAILTPSQKREDVKIPYTTATNIFFELVKGKVVAITGSKGKSTTTTLIFQMLRQGSYQTVKLGNITNAGPTFFGPPLLDLLYEDDPQNIYIVELSSYQLVDLRFSPHIAVITNIFPEHLTWHGDYEAYQNAKRQLIAHQSTTDFFFYKPTDPILSNWVDGVKSQGIAVDLTEAIDPQNRLLTKENRDNARLARAVARHLGIKDMQINQVVDSFRPLPNRLNNLGEYGGVIFYDDGASSAPEATISALSALPQTTTLLLGGQDRGYEYFTLIDKVATSLVKTIILFPDTDTKILSLIKDKFPKRFHVLQTSNMDEAIKYAYLHTQKGEICLLSPAAPSYSLWKNWQEKGEQYLDAIKKYAYTEK